MRKENFSGNFVVFLILLTLTKATSADPVTLKSKDMSKPGGQRSTMMKINPHYYNQLKNVCRTKKSVNCCMSSVTAMRKGNFTLAPDSGCPDEMVQNKLRCVDSFTWCEPKTAGQTEVIRIKTASDEKNESKDKKDK